MRFLAASRLRIVRANSAAENNTGEALSEFLRSKCFQLHADESHLHSANPGAGESDRMKPILDEIHDPETDRHLEIKSLARVDDKHQFIGAVQIVRDITERVKNEEEQHHLHDQLAQAQKLEAIGTLAGGIEVRSESGKGNTFEIFLPSVDLKQVDYEGDSQPLPTGNERILLIDDEETLVEMEKEMLEQLGYDIVVKTDSIEALDLFRAQPERFDLIITDQTMPHITGTELAKKLKVISPQIPIILCTGFSEVINEKKAEAVGISEYIMKPLVMADLANTIRKVLDKRSSES